MINDFSEARAATTTFSSCETPADWNAIAEHVLAGEPLTRAEAVAILSADQPQVLAITAAAYKLRHHYFQNKVQLYQLMNAKSGLCAEDCGYCSQSKDSEAEIEKYSFLSREMILNGAKEAAEKGAKTYCMVISGRSPTEREMKAVTTMVPEIKQKYGLHICACLGLLDEKQAQTLKDCGVDRVNHNVNSSEKYYNEICSTHTYEDRIETLNAVRKVGLEICSGGIIGMGESQEDVINMAFELRELDVQSIPINFYIPIKGAPLYKASTLTPDYCLKSLALFRFCCPDRELRIAGGREIHLRTLQPMSLYIANSIFLGDYLTTEGQAAQADLEMIADLGFEVVINEEVAQAMATS